ncbi:MAG: hypothetical protein ACYC77_03210 [Coriobacteriia bacterium]
MLWWSMILRAARELGVSQEIDLGLESNGENRLYTLLRRVSSE